MPKPVFDPKSIFDSVSPTRMMSSGVNPAAPPKAVFKTTSRRSVDASLAVDLQGVSVRFGHIHALEHVSLQLAQAEFLAVVGPNGAGKSTLMRVLLGLTPVSAGEVSVLAAPAGKLPASIGYVPQLKTFDRRFPATVLELVASGHARRWLWRVSSARKDAAATALETVGAGHLLMRRLSELSGGEVQRVFLARALVREPKLVILDEPATGVDFLAEYDLYRLLERYQQTTSATVIMVTHDLSVARHHASQVAVINRRLLGFGEPENVLCETCLKEAYGHSGHAHGILTL
ncbi:MAG: ABC transporter ATP-binding protein [Deinococcota bacterium]